MPPARAWRLVRSLIVLMPMVLGVLFSVALATAVYSVLARNWWAVGLLLAQLGVAVALRVLAG